MDLVSMATLPEGQEPKLELLRELSDRDLAALPSPEAKPEAVKRLRHSHHLAARLLAEGRKNFEVCALTGYSTSRISILQKDPAFSELVQYYKLQVQEKYNMVHEKLAALGETCVDELLDRLEANPQALSPNQILEIMEAALDRSVAPKKGVSMPIGNGLGGVTINVGFTEPPKAPNGQIIDIKPSDAA